MTFDRLDRVFETGEIIASGGEVEKLLKNAVVELAELYRDGGEWDAGAVEDLIIMAEQARDMRWCRVSECSMAESGVAITELVEK